MGERARTDRRQDAWLLGGQRRDEWVCLKLYTEDMSWVEKLGSVVGRAGLGEHSY